MGGWGSLYLECVCTPPLPLWRGVVLVPWAWSPGPGVVLGLAPAAAAAGGQRRERGVTWQRLELLVLGLAWRMAMVLLLLLVGITGGHLVNI